MEMWKVLLQQLALSSFCIFVTTQQNLTEYIELYYNAINNITTDYGNDSENFTTDPSQRMATYCKTPNDDRGYCIPIMKCSSLLNQLNNTDAWKFLLASQCGSRNENRRNPLVCCGKYSNYKVLSGKCGSQSVTISGRIMGGTEAEIGEFPWLARLYNRNRHDGTKQFGCTGFLISNKFVLTAAHCIESKNKHSFGPLHNVVLGEHNTNTKIDCKPDNTTCAPKIQTIKIKRTLVHPGYNLSSRHHHHDIGLIQLSEAAEITKFVYPICLKKQQPSEPLEYWLSGWGTTETDWTSHIKLKVSVPPFPHENCTKLYEKMQIKITDNQLCVGGKDRKDSCTGDSGGPLMLVENGNQWFAAGVVSFGLGCAKNGWPGIYTNIASYYKWIDTAVEKFANTRIKD